MNPSRMVRCGVCSAKASHKRKDRNKGKRALWTPTGPHSYARNFARTPTGIERCPTCAHNAGAATLRQDERTRLKVIERNERRAERHQKAA